jgi:SAM-dependent methyltransferase
VKAAFREAISPWTAQNPFLERCLKKPRGYAGDFAMMEVGYLRWTAMGGGLAGVFDRYFADCYDNVRQRKIKLCDAIRRYLVNSTRLGIPLRMLSLGSGPCREWVDLDHERRSGTFRDVAVNPTRLVCIDKDPESLAYARQQLAGNSLLESVEYVEADLFQFTRADRWRGQERSYDFIYGVGIANYFYDAMLQNIIASAFTLVKPCGELMITHKDGESFNFPVADWLCDWVFLRRSEPTFATVFREALADYEGQFAFRTERIPDRTMFFGFARRIT